MKKILALIGLVLLPMFGFSQLNEFEVRQMTQTAPEEQLVVESSRMLQENYFFFDQNTPKQFSLVSTTEKLNEVKLESCV